MTKLINLLILHTHPVQYWVPFYKSLANTGSLSISVIYCTDSGAKPYYDPGFAKSIDWDLPLLEGYHSSIMLPGQDISQLNFWSIYDSSLPNLLHHYKPDWILIDGYASRMNWFALSWASRHGAKIAFKSDSNYIIRRRKLPSFVKYLPIRYFFRNVSAFFSPSISNEKFLLQYGAHSSRIHRYPYPVDFDKFSAFRNVSRKYDFIWIGKLTPRKRPLDFINALLTLKKRGLTNFCACLVGDGELMNKVKDLGRELIEESNLTCQGFVNYSQVPAYLGDANTFVFTSENEPYGIVATEAAAAGAALIVAEGIGCVGRDSSAQPNINTLTYPTGNIDKLTDAMQKLLTTPFLLETMQEQSSLIGEMHSASNAARIVSSVLLSS